MSINRIDFGVIANTPEVSNIRAAEEARPLADQQNFQTQFNEEVETQQHSVNAKEDVGQGEMNGDAREKGSNEYMGDGGRNRRGSKGEDDRNSLLDRQLSVEKMEKMAENIVDRNGKHVDFQLSSGFDFKV